MVEGSFKSIEPLAYYVNDVEDLDRKVVNAYVSGDRQKIKELVDQGRGDYNVFICVNHNYHAAVVIIAAQSMATPLYRELAQEKTNHKEDFFSEPDELFCWKFELCFGELSLKTYKIRKTFTTFGRMKEGVKRAYYIGTYRGASPNAMEFAVLRAAPHRYNVLLNDCVEFAKAFCIEFLAYTKNYKEIEEGVEDNLKNASVTGLSIETLSRRVRSSGMMGNSFLGGIDISSYFSGQSSITLPKLLILVLFLMFSQVVISVIVFRLMSG